MVLISFVLKTCFKFTFLPNRGSFNEALPYFNNLKTPPDCSSLKKFLEIIF